jgi:hypothetical protein
MAERSNAFFHRLFGSSNFTAACLVARADEDVASIG